MNIQNNTNLLTIICGTILLLMVSSCKKEEQAPLPLELGLPAEVSLKYGEEKNLDLSTALSGRSDVALKVTFDQTSNIQITAGARLHDKLSQAITVDKDQVHINSSLLYPNGAVSTVNGSAIPADYKITISGQVPNGTVVGTQVISVKVSPGEIGIKGSENTGQYPFAYALFSKEETSFELESPTIPTTATTWHLPAVSGETGIKLEGNLIKFAGIAGNPAQQQEKTYDLEPALLKDGFSVASTKFKAIFVPGIKFFWGYYFPDEDMSISFPIIHYSLTDGVKTQAPAFYPAEYKGTFEIVKIEKLDPPYTGAFNPFTDVNGIFGIIGNTGEITVKPNNTLAPGHYKMTVKAISSIGLEFLTTFTLGLES